MKILILSYNKGSSKSATIIINQKIKTFNHVTNHMPNYLFDIWYNMAGTYYSEEGALALENFKKIKELSKQFDLVLYFKYGQLFKKWHNIH